MNLPFFSPSRADYTSSHFLLFFLLLTPVLSAPLSTLSPEIVFLDRRSVEIAWHLIVFYATNFVAHVASVPLSVEVEGPDQHRSLSEGSFPWAVLVSLFLPFRTLGRDLLLIAQELRHHDNVSSALSHGTLLVLARTKDWRPNGEIGDEVFVKLPANYDKLK